MFAMGPPEPNHSDFEEDFPMTHRAIRHASTHVTTFALALSALMGLTAAKGGCANEVIYEKPAPQPAPSKCQIGYHVEKQCSTVGYAATTGGGCYANGKEVDCAAPPVMNEECQDACVPDACEPGYQLQEVCPYPDCPPDANCAGWGTSGTTTGGTTVATSGGGAEPPIAPPAPGECHMECVPMHDCGGEPGSTVSVGSSGSTGTGL